MLYADMKRYDMLTDTLHHYSEALLNLSFPLVVNAVSLGKSGALEIMFEIIGPFSKKSTTLPKYVVCVFMFIRSENHIMQ